MPIYPRPLNPWLFFAFPFMLAVLLLIFEPTRLDFAISDLFYQTGDGFIWRYNFVFERFLHNSAKKIMIAVAYLLGIGFILSLFIGRLKPFRRQLGYTALAIALSVGMVALLKKTTHVHCPWSLIQYGGTELFTPLFEHLPKTTAKFGTCWPGGHAVSAFALFALFFALRDSYPRTAKAVLAFVVSLGILFSVARMMQGAHFFSHNLWTALISWLICGSLYWMILYRPAYQRLQATQVGTLQIPSTATKTGLTLPQSHQKPSSLILATS